MYKILVNATALVSGGSYNVVKFFVNDVIKSNLLEDKQIAIDILTTKEELTKYNSNNFNVIIDKYSKKNYFNRFIFENFIIRKLIKVNKYNAYLSLQNVGISHLNIPQFILIQTSLPFADIPKKYSHFRYWFIMRNIYKGQINNYDVIFVQSYWMKDIIMKVSNYKKTIKVLKPIPNNIVLNDKPIPENISRILEIDNIKLFYPTSNEKYKNIDFILKCIRKYNDLYDKKIVLYITINGESDKCVKYIGNIDYKSIYNIYKNVDALIFPSLVETLGLPLQEALMSGIDVIVADLPYAREVVKNDGLFFNPYDENSLISVLYRYANNRKEKININKNINFDGEDYSSYLRYIIEYLNKENN